MAGRWEAERITEVTDQDFERRSGVRSWEILPWPPRRRTCGWVGDMLRRVCFEGLSLVPECDNLYLVRYWRGSSDVFVASLDKRERLLLGNRQRLDL